VTDGGSRRRAGFRPNASPPGRKHTTMTFETSQMRGIAFAFGGIGAILGMRVMN